MELKLEVSETGKYGVIIGNGQRLSGMGICQEVTLQLGKLRDRRLPSDANRECQCHFRDEVALVTWGNLQ